jgi:hypothetical protein
MMSVMGIYRQSSTIEKQCFHDYRKQRAILFDLRLKSKPALLPKIQSGGSTGCKRERPTCTERKALTKSADGRLAPVATRQEKNLSNEKTKEPT